ncbi:MAG: class I mannose-6-phosphate isomerase [Bacteroidales bacterium]|nr:class I mannose-6-phosphate isomerase [Bacteroidales bacterium]
MEEKKLYPFRFCTLQDEYSWGSDEFKLADLGYRDSVVRDGWLAGNAISEVMDTYLDRVVGENVYNFWGRQFPVQVKHIRVKGKMPLRVHPDAETAEQRYDFLGREKLWYVLRAGKGARVLLGFNRDTDASELYGKCLDGSVEELLNSVEPVAGEFFHIRPGVPHAACGDIEIIEVSESSPLDFCLCSWGQEVSEEEFDPGLRLVDALDFIDYKAWTAPEAPHSHEGEVVRKLIDIPEFTVTLLQLTDPLHIYSERFDSFILYTCLRGEASVQLEVLGQTARFPFKKGETMLVPAECPDFFLVPTDRDTIILETTIAPREEKDSYLTAASR